MLPRKQLLPIFRHILRRHFRAMSPPALAPSAAAAEAEPSVRKTADIMASNLSKALAATSHDFRSDTVTVPTLEMLERMFTTATFTDDIYSRDPTTLHLETKMASLTGHEAGLFVTSGTMGNQLCLRTHLTQPPHSVLCDERAHIFQSEAGGLAMFSQAMVNTIRPKNGKYITLEEVKKAIVMDDIHHAPTRVVSLENTLHGLVLPYVEAKRISEYIRSEFKGGIKLHLDGARLWNAVIAEDITLKEYCSLFDSVSLCFSKGLSTPVGSVIVGSEPFIEKATHFKKAFGGGIRNPGILSAACLLSLEQVIPRIGATHVMAKELGARLEKIGFKLTLPVETNMIWLDLEKLHVSEKTFEGYGEREGVMLFDYNRIVVHHQTSQEAVEKLVKAMQHLMDDVKGGNVKQA